MSEMNRKFISVIGIQLWCVLFILFEMNGQSISLPAFFVGVGSLAGLGGGDMIFDWINALKTNLPAIIELAEVVEGAMDGNTPKNETPLEPAA